MLYLLLSLIVTLLLFGAFALCTSHDENSSWSFGFGALFIVSAIWFSISLIAIPVSREDTHVSIAEFEAEKMTIEQQRESTTTEYERVMLTETIVKNNGWLARQQTKASRNWTSCYYAKEILDVTPIE